MCSRQGGTEEGAGLLLLPLARAAGRGSAGEKYGAAGEAAVAAADAGGRSSKAEALARSCRHSACSGSMLKYVSRFHFMRLVLLVVWSEARGFPWIALPGVSFVT